MSENAGLPARFMKCQTGLAAIEFALIAPILLLLIFGIVIYSLYFCAYMGVREAAVEGARAAMAGLSTAERTTLATNRANEVLTAFAPLLGSGATPDIAVTRESGALLQVRISYDISNSPIMDYAVLLPMPSATLESEITVANGSY